MALLHLRHDDMGSARESSMSRMARRISGAFKLLHRSIVSAKLARVRNEWLFRRDYGDLSAPELDATKSPRLPLILGDKWDF